MTTSFGGQGQFVIGSDGSLIDLDSLPHTYTYNGSNQLITESVTNTINTWVKTYTYTGSNLTSESVWVKQ